MECQVEKLQHFQHILLLFGVNHSVLFLMLAYRHHFSSIVTIQNRNGRCCSRANRWRATRDAHMAIRWFLLFWLRVWVPIHPIFEHCPLNENVARWWNCHNSSHLPIVQCTDVDRCGLMCLNDLQQTPKVFLSVECHSCQNDRPQKKKNHFLAVLSPMALSPYRAQIFLAAFAAFAPLLNSKRRICRKCTNFSTWHSIF